MTLCSTLTPTVFAPRVCRAYELAFDSYKIAVLLSDPAVHCIDFTPLFSPYFGLILTESQHTILCIALRGHSGKAVIGIRMSEHHYQRVLKYAIELE